MKTDITIDLGVQGRVNSVRKSRHKITILFILKTIFKNFLLQKLCNSGTVANSETRKLIDTLKTHSLCLQFNMKMKNMKNMTAVGCDLCLMDTLCVFCCQDLFSWHDGEARSCHPQQNCTETHPGHGATFAISSLFGRAGQFQHFAIRSLRISKLCTSSRSCSRS